MVTGYGEGGSVERLVCVGPGIPTVFAGMGTNGWTPFDLTVGVGDFSIEAYVRAVQPSLQDDSYDLGLFNMATLTFDLNSDFEMWYGGASALELCPDPGCVANFFDVVGAGWAHNGGAQQYDCDGSQPGNSALTENGICTAGYQYLVRWTIRNRTAGMTRAFCGTQVGPWFTFDGDWAATITADAAPFGIEANATFVGSIDDVHITCIDRHEVAGGFGGDKKWHHVCANYDRDVQTELFIDGVSQGAHAIVPFDAAAPANIGATEFWPCVIGASVPTATENSNAIFAAVAMHTQLLTPEQMLDSMRRKSVQLLPTTLCAYDWRHMRGHTGWEENMRDQGGGTYLAHPGLAMVGAAASERVMCPEGTDGDVVVPDLSGNNRDLAYWTAEEYSVAVPGRSIFVPDNRFK